MRVIYLLLLFFITQQACFATRYAYTVSPKTIVYSDENLEIPIGFIKSGRKIMVSDKDLKANTITATFVSGRIAYIKLKDITFKINDRSLGGSPEIKDHDINILFQTDEDKLKENNHLSITAGKQQIGAFWDDLNEFFGASEYSNYANTVKLQLEHRSPSKNYGLAFSFAYTTIDSEVASFQFPTVGAEYQFRLIQFNIASIEAFGGFVFSGGAKLKTYDGQISRGVIYGYEVGGRARIFPFSKFSLLGSISMNSLSTRDLDPLYDDNLNEFTPSGNTGGVKVELGVSMKF